VVIDPVVTVAVRPNPSWVRVRTAMVLSPTVGATTTPVDPAAPDGATRAVAAGPLCVPLAAAPFVPGYRQLPPAS